MAREHMTTIQISKQTREELKEFGKKGEMYEEIVKRLIKLAETYNQGKV